MAVKRALFVSVLTALVVRSSTPIERQCFSSGFLRFEPFMSFRDAEDTGLLWMYVLYTPPRPKKLSRTHILLRTRSLILIILLIGCVESNPGEFYKYYFYYSSPHCLGYNTQNIYCNEVLSTRTVAICHLSQQHFRYLLPHYFEI